MYRRASSILSDAPGVLKALLVAFTMLLSSPPPSFIVMSPPYIRSPSEVPHSFTVALLCVTSKQTPGIARKVFLAYACVVMSRPSGVFRYEHHRALNFCMESSRGRVAVVGLYDNVAVELLKRGAPG